MEASPGQQQVYGHAARRQALNVSELSLTSSVLKLEYPRYQGTWLT